MCRVFFSFISISYSTFLVVRTIKLGIDVPGYASLITTLLFLGGIQLIGLGIIGEYLGRIFEEVKARPLYIIDSKYSTHENHQ